MRTGTRASIGRGDGRIDVTDTPTVLSAVDGAVATITLSRPDALNAITPGMLDELGDALVRAQSDPEVRVVVLTGEGRAFSAGVDLKALGDRSLEGGSVGDVLDGPARRAIEAITTMPKLVVARVNGFCFTGALELALACDLIVVASEAKLGDTHAKFGLRPTWGMSQRLIRLVGVARARELSYTARTFTGEQAAAWGLAARAVPHAELDDALAELLGQLLANSQGSLAAYKDLYRAALDLDLVAGIAYEETAEYAISDTDERVADFR
jgi:enoyl-CoA hydratase/carnithine racemase